MTKPTDLVQGTLDLLVLRTLALGPMHGWGIAQRIRQVSREVLQVQQGALYPALHRLERGGLLSSRWSEENGRRRRVYQLTARGQRELAKRRGEWRAFSRAVHAVVGGRP